jgi:hypothetical protein
VLVGCCGMFYEDRNGFGIPTVILIMLLHTLGIRRDRSSDIRESY